MNLPPQIILAVVIPAYKAEATIGKVIQSIPSFVSYIVVIDDKSPDQLASVVKEMAQIDTRLRLLISEKNEGVGGATLRGYKFAFGDLGANIAIKMDSDGQMDPRYIPSLINKILDGSVDYAKGNRFLHAKELGRMPLIRRLANVGLSFLIKFASGYWKIFDPTNGFTALHRNAYAQLDTSSIDNRFFFESSMLIELGKRRAVVKDIPMPAIYENEKSTLSEWQSLVEFPPKIIRGFLTRVIYQNFIIDFTAISIFLIAGISLSVFGFIWGIIHWIHSIHSGVPATTGTVMIAVMPLILGVQFLLQCVVMDLQNIPVEPLQQEEILA